MAYAVSTEVFEGPFDLLLHLILREQVDLYEISLARIVDAYLTEVETAYATRRGYPSRPSRPRHPGVSLPPPGPVRGFWRG